jgi:hypothetical protein
VQAAALQHVHEIHISAEVQLVGVVDVDAAILQKASEHSVGDRRTDLRLDVVTDDWHSSGRKACGPLGVVGV